MSNGPIGSGITTLTQTHTFGIGLFLEGTITFYVVQSCRYKIILGHTWLAIHDHIISWNQEDLAQWSAYCHTNCLTNTLSLHCLSTRIESPEVMTQTLLLPVYAEFSKVLVRLKPLSYVPPHWPWDCAIDLLPNMSLPKHKVYILSRPKTQAMETYIEEALASGYKRQKAIDRIRNTVVPTRTGTFIMKVWYARDQKRSNSALNNRILNQLQQISVHQWHWCWGRQVELITSHRSSVYPALCKLYIKVN